MNDIWILTVKTSLPHTAYNTKDMTTTCEAFDSFEKGRHAMREVIRKYAFSKNSMFDGKGNITYLNKYAKDFANESYEDDNMVLDLNRINYIIDTLREAFSGKDVLLEPDTSYCTDWMIGIESHDGEITISGEDDGPCNGYDPDVRTNIFTMEEEKHYFLYINDRFGQYDDTSELYIDLQKAHVR